MNYSKLLAAIAKKQKNALKQLYEHEVSAMLALAFQSLHHRTYAEQAVFQSFMTYWDNANIYRADQGSAKGWLYSILRHQIREVYQEQYATLGLLHAKEPCFVAEPMSQVQAQLNPNLDPVKSFCYIFEQLTQEQQNAVINTYLSPDSLAVVATRLGLPLRHLREDISVAIHHLVKYPGDLPRHDDIYLLGEYILGGVNGPDLQKVEHLLANDEQAITVLLAWEEKLSELIQQLPLYPQDDDKLWKKLTQHIKQQQLEQKMQERRQYDSAYEDQQTQLDAELTQQIQEAQANGQKLPWRLRAYFLWRNLKLWRVLAAFAIVLALLSALWPSSGKSVQWVAVLNSQLPQSAMGQAWLLKIQSDGQILIGAQFEQLGENQYDLQLWLGLENPQTYRSLGVLNSQHINQINADLLGNPHKNMRFYISLEPKGGSGSSRPTGSILYQGALLPLE